MVDEERKQRRMAGATAWECLFDWNIRTAEAVIKGLLTLIVTCLGCVATGKEYESTTQFFFDFSFTLVVALPFAIMVRIGLSSARTSIKPMFLAEPRSWAAKLEVRWPWLGRAADATPHVMMIALCVMLIGNFAPVYYPLYWFGHHWQDARNGAICETRQKAHPGAPLSLR